MLKYGIYTREFADFHSSAKILTHENKYFHSRGTVERKSNNIYRQMSTTIDSVRAVGSGNVASLDTFPDPTRENTALRNQWSWHLCLFFCFTP